MLHDVTFRFRRIAGTALLALLVVLCCSCSRRERAARLLIDANRHYASGEFDLAEIAYKNVLQKDPQNADAIARLGILYHEEGRNVRAAVYLMKARELQLENLEVRSRFALAHLANGGIAAAREEALYILGRQPTHAEAPLLLVEASREPKDLEDARERLLALPATAAKAPPALVALAHIAMRQNKPAEAEALLAAALAADSKSAAAHSGLAVLRLSRKDVAGADEEFKQAAELSSPRSIRRLHYARFKLYSGDLSSARTLLEEMSRKTPDFVTTWLWLAEVAMMEKKTDEADAFLAKALAREPQDPEARLMNARIRLSKGETAKAMPELERLQADFPKSPQVAYQLALAQAAAGETSKAISRLNQVVAAAPELPQASLTLAQLHFQQRDYSTAAAVLKPVAQQHPEIIAAQILLAEANRAQGNLAEAAAIYTQLQQRFPNDPQTTFARATVLLQQNKLAEARAMFEKTRDLHPGHFAALEQLVALDHRDKAFIVARQRIEADLAKDSQSAPLHLLLAKNYLVQRDTEHAEAALKQAIALQPESSDAQVLLARLYLDSRQQDKAIARLQEAARQQPRSAAPQLMLGALLHERKDYAGARDAYEKVIAVDPKNVSALNNLACMLADQFGQLDSAIDLAQRARAAMPQEPRIADTLGWLLQKKQQFALALPLLQESAGKLRDQPEVQYHLGVVLYALGDEAAAQSALQRALDQAATFPQADDARARVGILKIPLEKIDASARVQLEERLAACANDTAALLRLAEFAREAGEADSALMRYNAILKTNPKHAAALIGTARLALARKDSAKAIEFAKAARAAAPNQSEITHAVGRIAYDTGDFRWAASLLQDAAKARPDDPVVLFDWAEAAFGAGRLAEAETSAQRALEIDPQFPRAPEAKRFSEMLQLCANPSIMRESSTKIDAALKAHPTNAAALLARAIRAEQHSDSATARRDYETLLGRFPEFSPAQRGLAILYARDPADAPKAAAVAVKARQAFPADLEVARAAGIIAYRQGEYSRAINLLQECTAKKARDSEAMYYLGMAQWRLNKRSESKQSLQRALDLGLTDVLAVEARKSLDSSE